MWQPHLLENRVQILRSVHIQERPQARVNHSNLIRRDEHGPEAVYECRWGGGAGNGVEDFEDPRAPVHGSDRVQDIEFRDGSIVIAEDIEKELVQLGPEERSVTGGDENDLAAGRAEPLAETLDRT